MTWALIAILCGGVAATIWMTLEVTTRSRRPREIARKTERKALAAVGGRGARGWDWTRSYHWTPDAHPCWGFGGNVCPYPLCPTNRPKGRSSNYTREILQHREEPKLPNLEDLATQIAMRRLPRPPQRPVVAYDEAMARAGLIEPEMVKETFVWHPVDLA